MRISNFQEKFYLYDGCSSVEELLENIERLKLPKSKCYIIKFRQQYYAVFYDNIKREVIIGDTKVFYSKNGRLEESTIAEAKIPFPIESRDKRQITPTLAIELNAIDPSMEVLYYPNVNSKELKVAGDDMKHSKYVVVLGVTFASKYYTLGDERELSMYFVHTNELMSFLRRTKEATAIDPFSNLIRFRDGSLGKYSIVFYNDYYGGNTTSFALQERNIYGALTKRAWMSLTQYQALYPNEFILYEKPDFRDSTDICKWCGKPLSDKRKAYCSDECRMKFVKATDVEKASALPYRILSRDNFTCGRCGKDLSAINEHGMRIPISKLKDKPDKDGKFRAEAEVHHDPPIEDGGTDQQNHLFTRCCYCHDEEHTDLKMKKVIIIDFGARERL